jgi:hypothetical protein
VRSREYADKDDNSRDQREDREDGIGDACSFFLIALREQLCIDRNERGGECAFAKNVLQEIWNSKRSAESVAFCRTAEVVCKDSLADESNDPADEDSRSDKESGSAGAGFCARCWRRCRCADLFYFLTGDFSRRFLSDELDVFFFGKCQRAYSLILLSSVL